MPTTLLQKNQAALQVLVSNSTPTSLTTQWAGRHDRKHPQCSAGGTRERVRGRRYERRKGGQRSTKGQDVCRLIRSGERPVPSGRRIRKQKMARKVKGKDGLRRGTIMSESGSARDYIHDLAT
jgi:hypothetical protein